jgi:glucan-binding YG repeat protein/N-acetylmuramoyl-L-alanine amidase
MKTKKGLCWLLTFLMLLSFMLTPASTFADSGKWVASQSRWWYQNADGTYPAASWMLVNGRWYYFDQAGWMTTGWQKVGANWYYMNADGQMLTGWQKVGNAWYYMQSSGEMAANTWIGSYYVDGSGAWIEGKTQGTVSDGTASGGTTGQAKAAWIKSGNRWWYRHSDGGYTTSNWENIDGVTYYFDQAGWMTTGWQQIGGIWYYMAPGGQMTTGWQLISGIWYYMASNGQMQTGWQQVGGAWYYMAPGGQMLTGWQQIGGIWYYMAPGGQRMTGWQQVGGTWYYMASDGQMLTGWQQIGGVWYYMNTDGRMLTGWQQIGGTWYYLKASGAMAADTWINGYYVNSSGAWIPDASGSSGSGGKIIAIDAGHQRTGNSEKEPVGPGSSTMKAKVASGTSGKWSGLKEYELTLQVSLQLQAELQTRGYQVYMIRTTHDVNISNAERAKNAANAGADILVRIHANGDDNSSVSGALTMAPSNSNPYLSGSLVASSQKLSTNVVNSLCASAGAKNRGVMTTDTMSGINWSTIPVTIVEMGFMTNQTEDLNMANAGYQSKMVQGIANGIDQYYAS